MNPKCSGSPSTEIVMRKGNKVIIAARGSLWRKTTHAEKDEWRADKQAATVAARAAGEDTFDINFDCAGESRLPPMTVSIRRVTGEFTVVRARAAGSNGYYNPIPGCCVVVDADGVEWFAHRHETQVVAGDPTTPKSKTAAKDNEVDAAIKAFTAEILARSDAQEEAEDCIMRRHAMAKGHKRYTTFAVKWGRKYAKIVRGNTRDGGGTVFCFVNRENGDILKAASGNAPAKHARGNVLLADRLGAVGKYGANYMR
jgi:hypothetical protein